MPRQARLDAPGTLHHVFIRGIERKEIEKDDHDSQNFVYRMGTIALETGTLFYAWTLMANHAHIFFFCAALHLVFPGICAACYLVMLFHITVATAGMSIYFKIVINLSYVVENLAKRDRYRYCGHSVLMDKVKNYWQDRDYVLKWFAGGLIISQGGWSAVKALKSGSRRRKITIVRSQLACVP